ncbi:MAG: bifunctional folylpolyglutamate synthase/dihydrofolate synthase [Ilumatobacteraceae bacterium]|nr:bifunctional folylpolyglutamate synthase/dihydrofolate synthase [Ilumatobacteraceae bacterium]
MLFADALHYLDEHASYDKTGRIESPSLDKTLRLLSILDDPHTLFRIVHVTGTNGKGSTSQIITQLLMAHGLRVGTYSSPHLEKINERLSIDGEAISDEEFGNAISSVADAEVLAGVRPSYFEIVTAAAFRWFADNSVDVGVIEVGMLGRWDATNVVNADVAVITNIALDHTEFAGPELSDIAREKAGIIKPASSVVVGETRPTLVDIFRAETSDQIVVKDEDFSVIDNQLALGGRLLHIRTPRGDFAELYLPLHGAHQGENAAVALMSVEEFFRAPLHFETVEEAFANVSMPGRFEIVSYQPLIILDGAHNPAGADVCAQVFFEDFDPPGRRILIVGALQGRDIYDTLSALRADEFDLVICCTAPSPRARNGQEIASAAQRLGCSDVVVLRSVQEACDRAVQDASSDDAILIAGSLYVVGAARPHLRRIMP